MTWHRNIHIWIYDYYKRIRKINSEILFSKKNIHVMFCLTDHYEPFNGDVPREKAVERVDRWLNELPKLALNHVDSHGFPYKHTMFYPIEQYDASILEMLSELQMKGVAEVEVHLHHDNDTAENLKKELLEFKDVLSTKHKLLCRGRNDNQIKYGFIHGNWALDNSHPQGKWCGVNNEIDILQETGCYADFTFPSAPSATQTKKVNSIYYAVDDPQRPKSHNTGDDARAGFGMQKGLMLIQGPLALDFSKRKFGILPKIENGEVGWITPPTLQRFQHWLTQHIHVTGRDDWVFIKVYTHGAVEHHANILLGDAMENYLDSLLKYFSSRKNMQLHFVSAREMYNIVRAAEDGKEGNPAEYRDYELVKL